MDTKVGFSLLSANVNSSTAKHALICWCHLQPSSTAAFLNSAFCEITKSGDSRLFALRIWVQSPTKPRFHYAQNTMTGATDYTSKYPRFISLKGAITLRVEPAGTCARCHATEPEVTAVHARLLSLCSLLPSELQRGPSGAELQVKPPPLTSRPCVFQGVWNAAPAPAPAPGRLTGQLLSSGSPSCKRLVH